MPMRALVRYIRAGVYCVGCARNGARAYPSAAAPLTAKPSRETEWGKKEVRGLGGRKGGSAVDGEDYARVADYPWGAVVGRLLVVPAERRAVRCARAKAAIAPNPSVHDAVMSVCW